jgi:hypothetical protein
MREIEKKWDTAERERKRTRKSQRGESERRGACTTGPIAGVEARGLATRAGTHERGTIGAQRKMLIQLLLTVPVYASPFIQQPIEQWFFWARSKMKLAAWRCIFAGKQMGLSIRKARDFHSIYRKAALSAVSLRPATTDPTSNAK